MRRICVFCGSSPGARVEYAEAARRLGTALARHGIAVVYGGGKLGMMGQLARAALAAEGEVIGVIPRDLVDPEVALTELSDLRVVDSMHERKALMAELADAFIALPGGLGTIEEFFEALTWAQLGMHAKPCGLANVCGYFDHLIAFLHYAESERFIGTAHRETIVIAEEPEDLIEAFSTYDPPRAGKAAWARRLSGGLAERLDDWKKPPE